MNDQTAQPEPLRLAEQKLWVVISAYNEEAWIAGALRALAAQKHRDFSLVVVDNGSTDRTADVVRAFVEKHPEMRVDLIQEAQKGTGAASDTGMRHAIRSGATWLARTDADCVPARDWTAQAVAAFASGLELVSGQLLPRRDEGIDWKKRMLILGVIETASLFGKIRQGNKDPQYLGPYVMTPGCNMAITAELYVRSGGFPR